MKIFRIAVIIALLLPACSCVPLSSFYPLWDEQHAAFEPRLLGEWREKDSSVPPVLMTAIAECIRRSAPA